MTRKELKEKLMASGIESAHLDEIVHNAASQAASEANNGGLDSQIDFLIDKQGWTPEDILKGVNAI